MDRQSQIIRTSWVGIGANVLLAAFKAVVGLVAGSVAIVMDAVNNLSDALSSVITILGAKLSVRPADREHPFGFGRVEYFSAIIIALIVLAAGVTSLVESVRKIFVPTTPTYTTVTLVVIIVAIAVKLLLGRYVKHKGEQLKSDALVASGSDALFDAIITVATLVSAGIMLLWNVSIDGWLGAVISLLIIKAGFETYRAHQRAAGQEGVARADTPDQARHNRAEGGAWGFRHHTAQLWARRDDRLAAHKR